MTTTHEPLHSLARDLRAHGPVLLAGMPQPHEELLTLVWGPRFDREHALGLMARQPQHAARALPALLEAADIADRARALTALLRIDAAGSDDDARLQ